VHTWGIGDWICFTPVLRALKVNFPQASFDLILGDAGVRQVLEFFPEVHLQAMVEVVRHPWSMLLASLKTRPRRYDALVFTAGIASHKADFMSLLIKAGHKVALTTQGSRHLFLTRTSPYDNPRHRVENNLKLLPLLGINEIPANPYPYLPFHGPPPEKGSVLIHPGCGKLQAVRRWPEARFAQVAKGLLGQGRRVGVILGPQDLELAGAFSHLAGQRGFTLYQRLSFREAVAVMASHETLCNSDSGLGHVAAALGRPVVSIFGPADPVATRPYSKEAVIITATPRLPCMPCWGKSYGCSERPCLFNISADMVLEVL